MNDERNTRKSLYGTRRIPFTMSEKNASHCLHKRLEGSLCREIRPVVEERYTSVFVIIKWKRITISRNGKKAKLDFFTFFRPSSTAKDLGSFRTSSAKDRASSAMEDLSTPLPVCGASSCFPLGMKK